MQTWLKCKVSPGQFSVEYAVQGETFDGSGFSLFAPSGAVELERQPPNGEPVDGFLRVEVQHRDGQLCLVRLPAQVIGFNEYVTVRANQLQTRRSTQKV